MATFRERPYSGMNYLVDLGAGDSRSPQSGFSEVILPEITVDYVRYRNGNERISSPRITTHGFQTSNAILKRGVIGSLDLSQWIDQVREGDENAFRRVRIQLLSEDGEDIAVTWTLFNAIPVKFSFGKLDAQDNAIAVEYLELACEDLRLE